MSVLNLQNWFTESKTENGTRQIYCIGMGIKGISHLTLEALTTIQKAQLVLHIGLTDKKLNRLNQNIKSLEHLYWSGKKDSDTYKKIVNAVITMTRSMKGTTVFLADGNPVFFNDITWGIYSEAKKKRIPVTILPGISCLDVLPIDILMDMGDMGTQIFEANQLVIYDLNMNAYLSTFILQAGWFGMPLLKKLADRRRNRFKPLIDHLLKYYSDTHPAIFIMSADKPTKPSVVFRTTVSQIGLYSTQIQKGMTLYLPRLDNKVRNYKFYQSLKQLTAQSKK